MNEFPELDEIPDRRISVVRTAELLVIRIRRASTFWQPVTLVAVFGILLPIVGCAVGADVIFLLHSVRQGHLLRGGSALVVISLMLSPAVCLTFLAACKTTLLIAEPDSLVIQTRWLSLKRAREFAATDIATFEARESLLRDGHGGAVAVYELWLIQTNDSQKPVFKSVRINRNQMNQLARTLAAFYQAVSLRHRSG